MKLRPRIAIPPLAADDPRVGHLLQSEPTADTEVVLLGFPTDIGVRRNHGRPGAAGGPGALRSALYRMTPDARIPEHVALLQRTCDLGDLVVTEDLERAQRLLGSVVGEQLAGGRRVVVLGGGRETAFGHFLGYVEADLTPITLFNLDAHPDVRPLRDGRAHSGSPFRQALEFGAQEGPDPERPDLEKPRPVREYIVSGLQPHAVAVSHLDFLRSASARVEWAGDVSESSLMATVESLTDPAMVTLDLDVVDGSQAPGVSAPAAGGLDAELLLWAAELAGRSPSVRSLDVVELNPRFDVDGRTARLAALAVWRFLAGMAMGGGAPAG